MGAGKREGTTPLTGTGFGGHPFDPEFFIVIGLGNGGVGFMAARWAGALIFKIDAGRGVQRFF